MARARPIELRSGPLAGGRVPAVCAPLVARTGEALLAEVAAVAATGPDLLEWRADFFEGVARAGEVVDLGRRLRAAAGATPLLFTCRRPEEGGAATALSDDDAVRLHEVVCADGFAELLDYELAHPAARVARVRDACRAAGVRLVLSWHDFAATPPADAVVATLRQAERAGADVAKVAVTPRAIDEVLVLLAATLRAHRELHVPLVTISMGPLGALSRACGFAFGSALTFAVGQGSSAPGQLPMAELRAALDVLRRAMGDVDI